MKRKGQVTAFIFFIFSAVILIVIATVTVKTGIDFTTNVYALSDDILRTANNTAQTITLASIRVPITEDITNAIASTSTNSLIVKQNFQWIWLLLLLIMFITLYLSLEKRSSTSSRGFV